MNVALKKSSLLYLVILSAFGPYIFPSLGIRLDQLIIYGIFLFLLLSNSLKLPRESTSLSIIFLLFSLFLFPFVQAINPIYVLSNSLLLAQVENYLQPIIIFLIFFSLLPPNKKEIEEILKFGFELILWLLSLNTIFSIYIFLNPDTSLINIFTGSKIIGDFGGYSDVTLAELNLTTGKFAGVFNQTFIVGFVYSLGLLIWGYLYKNRKQYNFKKAIFLILILIGGVMSFSKVFLVIGAPLFLLFLGLKRSLIFLIFILFTLLLMFLINPNLFELVSDYKAMNYIFRLITGVSGDFLTIFTSSRLGSDSAVIEGIIYILSNKPLFGFGYGSIETSDFSFYEIVSLGGLMGLLAYTFLLLILITPIFNLSSFKDKYFYGFFISLTFIASLAAPIFTANRVSILIWFIIVITYSRSQKNSKT
tara:strand:+ start:1979 stop:3238 length:1260 start_codon:yes stop_codon:yes gene_type:complete